MIGWLKSKFSKQSLLRIKIYIIIEFSVIIPLSIIFPNLFNTIFTIGITMGAYIIADVVSRRLTSKEAISSGLISSQAPSDRLTQPNKEPSKKASKEAKAIEKNYMTHYKAVTKDIEKLKAGYLQDEERQIILGNSVKTLLNLCADELNIIKQWNLPFEGQFADRLRGLEAQFKSDTTQPIPCLIGLKGFLNDFDESLCKMLSTELGKEIKRGESIVSDISALVDLVLMYH